MIGSIGDIVVGLDPVKNSYDRMVHAADVYGEKGFIQGSKQLAAENIDEAIAMVKDATGYSDFQKMLNPCNSTGERIVYGASGAAKVFLILSPKFSKSGKTGPPKPPKIKAPKKNPYSNPKNRPPYAKGQVEQVWENSKQVDAKVYDRTGTELKWDKTKPRNRQWNMGHKKGRPYRDIHEDYIDDKISREEFMKEYHDPNNYIAESWIENQGHKFE
jgi:hypothetical protein